MSVPGAVVRSLLSVAVRTDAIFVSAMIRTSCSVNPRVVIFHISALPTFAPVDVAIVGRVPFADDPRSGQIANSCGDECHPLLRPENWRHRGVLTRVRARFAGRGFDALPPEEASIDGP